MMVMNSYTNCTVVYTDNNRFDIGLSQEKNPRETLIFLSSIHPKKEDRTSSPNNKKTN